MASPRSRKRIDRGGPTARRVVQRVQKASDGTKLKFGGKSFRFVALQPLSLAVEDSRSFALSIQNIPCRFALRPLHSDGASQRTHGGTLLAIDFSLANETDLLDATRTGLDLVEDFLSAVSLIEGATFCDAEPIQIVCSDHASGGEHPFLYFLKLSMFRWDSLISNATIQTVRDLLSHWDGLDSGNRLRRAAHSSVKPSEPKTTLLRSSTRTWAWRP